MTVRTLYTVSSSVSSPVAVWLWLCCALVFGLVVLGGAVRLTGSGLSMVDWRVIGGVIPPLSADEWRRAFAAYQTFPEFRLRNSAMTLGGFQFIFWMEYAHRLLARIIGIVFVVPFAVFAWRKMLPREMLGGLCGLFLLGGAQGLLGWWMVKSGLQDRPEVSHYRLLAHFMLAAVIYVLLLRYAIGARFGELRSATHFGIAALAVTGLMLASGALVAGTNAGKIFNTFPAMGDSFLPPQLFAMSPLWKNFLDNPITIQLTHRILAVVVLVTVIGYAANLWRAQRRRIASALLITVAAQITLGILTLLYAVPVALGIAHQATAMLLLTAVVFALLQSRDEVT